MNTLIPEVLEVNSPEFDGVILGDEAMGDEQVAMLLAEHEAEAAWERACELGHGAW